MTPATRTLLEALTRLGKGALAEFDKWLRAQTTADQESERRSG